MLDRMLQAFLNSAPATRLATVTGVFVALTFIAIFTSIQLAALLLDGFADIENDRRRLGVLQATIAAADRVSREKAPASADDTFFFGASDAVVKAKVQSWLQNQVVNSGLELASVTDLPNKEVGSTDLVGLRASLSGPYENIQALLLAIETNRPPMFITKVLMTSGFGPSASADTVSIVNASLELYVAAEMSGDGA